MARMPAMHVYSRPIYVTRTPEGAYRVTAHRGWVSAPVVREFEFHAQATAFAVAKLGTKYWGRSCVVDETQGRE